MTTGGTTARVKSADRTLELLELLAGSPDRRTPAELARDLAIPKSSLHGLLQTLVQRGWLEVDSSGSRYGLGLQALRAGGAYLRADRAVRRLTPVVERLHEELGATVRLGRLVGDQVVCLVSRERHGPAAGPGRHTPARDTAMGAVLLARWAERELTPTGGEWARIRAQGYALAREETDGVAAWCVAVAAPPRLGPYDAIGVSLGGDVPAPERARAVAGAIGAAVTAELTGRSGFFSGRH
ncbi:helix-turn-helix domain-containing protein [Micromonospora sp. NPDC023966]|uniref:IclR family transcriptional regulator n=1 Tax=Micromonospora sp. NPDC023966 TaxID=3154699 RepID=UPI0033F875A0